MDREIAVHAAHPGQLGHPGRSHLYSMYVKPAFSSASRIL